MLYKDWLYEWLELYVKATTNERTYNKYRQQAERYIIPTLGGYDANDISAIELQKFSYDLTERGLASNTVNSIVSILKSSLKKGAKLGVIDKQYSDVIVRPKSREHKVTCFNKTEQKKIERYVFGRNKPMLFGIVLCLYTGLRIGELLALTWDDVDFQKGTLSVTKSCHDSWNDNRYVKILDPTKTQSSERIIPLPRQIVAHMKALRKSTDAKFVVIGKSEYGAEVRSYQRTFSIVLKNLDIAHKGFHALRHTFATRALEMGMDIKTLSEILGHRNPTVTLCRYSHSLMEHKIEMMNKLGKLLS